MLAAFAVAGALATAALVGVGAGDWMLAAVLYAIGRVAFASSIVMYDSLLPHVAAPEDMDRVSSRGFAWGYLGGGILLAAQIVVITRPEWFGIADAEWATRLVFLSVGVWWIAFTLPLLRDVPERVIPAATAKRIDLVAAFARLRQTFHELRRYREAFRFLIAFWLYNDGIGTIVVMATAFGAEIGIGRTQLIAAILLVQFLGFPFSLLFGRLAGRVGARNAILVGLAGYTVLCCLAWFVQTERDFFLLAIGVAMFQGGCQALSRSLFARMIPVERSSEFFGFYDVSSKFAGIVGPFLLATVARLTGASRYGIFALIVLFVAGMIVLWRVDPEKAQRDLAENVV
jgi:UMF1 family MFS transporter